MPLIWSAWQWVIKTASKFLTFAFKSCCLKSGVASTNIDTLEDSIKMDDLSLLFFGFSGLQLPQLFPIAGTPEELPQPKTVISSCIFSL